MLKDSLKLLTVKVLPSEMILSSLLLNFYILEGIPLLKEVNTGSCHD
jgi:hypothetical protein